MQGVFNCNQKSLNSNTKLYQNYNNIRICHIGIILVTRGLLTSDLLLRCLVHFIKIRYTKYHFKYLFIFQTKKV